MKFRRKDLSFLLIITSLIVFISPMIFIDNPDKLIVLSTCLTALGACATVFTAFIAISLYDKFGIDQKLIIKQADKVLELIDLLKGKLFIIKTEKAAYYLRLNIIRLKTIKSIPDFRINSHKNLIVRMDDYDAGVNELINIRRSYWLPKEINKKLEFIEASATIEITEKDETNFILLDFGTGKGGDKRLLYPEITSKMFLSSLHNLIIEIENWQKKYTSVIIDFKMEEADIFKNNS